MTLVQLANPIAYPGINITPVGAPALATVATVDASGEYVSYIFSAREDMTISHVGFMVGAVANSPTMEIRIETVDASGLPSGTLWNSPTNTTNVTTAALSAGWTLQALTAAATVTKGQVVCVKLLWGGVATSTLVVQHLVNGPSPFYATFPYTVINVGTPTKSGVAAGLPAVAFGSSSTTFYNVPGFMPTTAFANGTFNNTNSAKRGLRFVPTFNCRAIGIRWYKSTGAGDYNFLLMNDAGTELSSSSTAYDGDYGFQNASTGLANVYFVNPVTLTRSTAYRIAIEPSSATNVNISTITLPSADYFSATPAVAATSAQYFTYVASSFTDSTTQLPLMDVLIDQIDDGTGSGSSGGQRVISG